MLNFCITINQYSPYCCNNSNGPLLLHVRSCLYYLCCVYIRSAGISRGCSARRVSCQGRVSRATSWSTPSPNDTHFPQKSRLHVAVLLHTGVCRRSTHHSDWCWCCCYRISLSLCLSLSLSLVIRPSACQQDLRLQQLLRPSVRICCHTVSIFRSL